MSIEFKLYDEISSIDVERIARKLDPLHDHLHENKYLE